MICLTYLLSVAALTSLATAQVNATVSIPGQDTYLLSRPFFSNSSQGFLETETSNNSLGEILGQSREAFFISFDTEFDQLLGANATVETIAQENVSYAFEAGVYYPTQNQLWFSSNLQISPSYISILDLNTSQVFQPNLTSSVPGILPLANPNGGFYSNGTIYFTTIGNVNVSSSIVAINPVTYEVTEVVNSYYGLYFNGIDDMIITSCKNTGNAIFFTDLDATGFGIDVTYTSQHPSQLASGVWRLIPSTQNIHQVIPRADIAVPNGIAFDATAGYVYVTDFSAYPAAAGAVSSTSSPSIYRYTLDDDCNLTNKIQFAYIRDGAGDGLRVDAQGRVWTVTTAGVEVRNPAGKLIGLFNRRAVVSGDSLEGHWANFAFAGDRVYILGNQVIYMVQTTQTLANLDD